MLIGFLPLSLEGITLKYVRSKMTKSKLTKDEWSRPTKTLPCSALQGSAGLGVLSNGTHSKQDTKHTSNKAIFILPFSWPFLCLNVLALDTLICKHISYSTEDIGVAAKGLTCRENCCDRCCCTGSPSMPKHSVRIHTGRGSDVDTHKTSALGGKIQNALIQVTTWSNKFLFVENFHWLHDTCHECLGSISFHGSNLNNCCTCMKPLESQATSEWQAFRGH